MKYYKKDICSLIFIGIVYVNFNINMSATESTKLTSRHF